MIGRVIGVASGFLSIFLFLFGDAVEGVKLRPQDVILISFFIVSILLYAWFEIKEYLDNREIVTKSNKHFYKFMENFIDHEGAIAILSENLSWVQTDRLKKQFESKAQSGDLTIIMEVPSAFSQKLQELGGKVKYYKDIKYVPQSRFTIVRYRSPHGKVAVGWPRRNTGKKKIKEERIVHIFEQSQDPFFTAACDLIEMLERSL